MKKVFLVLVLLMLFLVGCKTEESPNVDPSNDPINNPSTEPSTDPSTNPSTEPSTDPSTDPEVIEKTSTDGFIIDQAMVDNENKGIKIDFHLNESELKYLEDNNESLVNYCFIIQYKRITDINELIIDITNQNNYIVKAKNELNVNSIIFNNDLENNYKEDISIRVYYEYYTESNTENVKTRLSTEFKTYNIYDLALESDGTLSDLIIDAFEDKLKEIKIVLDTTNYVVSTESSYCTVAIKKPLDYNTIDTIITLNSDVKLASDFKLIVNEKVIDSSKYSYVDGVITYIIEDPNWSPIY